MAILSALALLSQEVTGQSFDEEYFKRNAALTDLARLGVNDEGYARCVTSINLRDTENNAKMVTLDETEFRDDGQNNDLRANDGILTSVKLFAYSKGESTLPAGVYQKTPDDYIVHDEIFEHLGSGRLPLPKISVSCKITVRGCGDFPEPQRTLCYQAGPPYVHFQFHGCHLSLSW
jgi:hypothetical protein